MSQALLGKTAVITGGSGGIGRYLCEGFAAEGAAVVITDMTDAPEAMALVEAKGGTPLFVKADLAKAEDIGELARRVEAERGGCDILIHCAAYQPHMAFEDVPFADWQKTMAVNVDGLFHLLQAFLPHMKAKQWGRVVSLTSATYYDATPLHSEYVTSKAASIGLIRIIAKEYGKFGITANTLAPGLTRTPNSEDAVRIMLAAGEPDYYEMLRGLQSIPRTLEPYDIVDPVVFLATDKARAITGQSILADGGWHRV
jgi:NAD(P)-dependent dehydrogenase (short-subunit alcohol dehydrogenase family)